jgi:hypothetical protein
MFGRLVHGGAGDGARKARARFFSNAAHKHPDTAVAALLGNKMSRAAISEADPCMLADALSGLVAFSNADAEGMQWLASVRDRARLCQHERLRALSASVAKGTSQNSISDSQEVFFSEERVSSD